MPLLRRDGDLVTRNGNLVRVSEGGAGSCECCGDPVTCNECADDCCHSEASTADVTWSFTPGSGTGSCCSEIASYSISGLTYISDCSWQLAFEELADEDCLFRVTVRKQIDGEWELEIGTFDSIGIDFVMSGTFSTGPACCGFSNEESAVGDSDFCNAGTIEASVTINNNFCCKCDVSGTPTCVEGAKDYASDCTAGGNNECNDFTGGSEGDCDDAPS